MQQKRRRIFDTEEQSPIKSVQRYCKDAQCFDEEMKSQMMNAIKEKQDKLKSTQITYTEEEIIKLKEYTLKKLNITAQAMQLKLDQIKLPEINHQQFEQRATELQNKLSQKHNQYQKELDQIKPQIDQKIEEQQLMSLLSAFTVPTTVITKATHEGFIETAEKEIRQYGKQLYQQLQYYEKELQPPPTSDIQNLNSMLDSVHDYEEIHQQYYDLDRQMNEFQKQLEI